ncbi:hypothetical protein CSB11_01250 [Candidatus Campbellbacteria bacterium]|nr:MAG: hypothetical protein CSB11_01250 [Candidatus Campbellbacteria bacterium]
MEEVLTLLSNPSNQIYQIFIALFLGIFLGLRKEMWIQKNKTVAVFGLRTTILIVMLGTISTFFTDLPYLPIVFFLAIFTFVAIAYFNGVFKLNLIGLTSEFQALIAFWIGVLVGYEKVFTAIILTVILSILMAYKENFHNFAKNFSLKEYSGSLKLLIITAVVLPFLPTEPIDPWGVFIPFNIWLIVIFISSIGFIGYFLNKYFGSRKSVMLTSVLGSLVSSTIVTTSLASKSKTSNIKILSIGILISILVMQIRILIEILTLLGGYSEFNYIFIIPSIFMILSSVILVFIYRKKYCRAENIKDFKHKLEVKSPFEILPALKFGFLFSAILFAIYFGNKYFGQIGGYFVVFLSSFTDADAVVLSTAESFKTGGATGTFLAYTILIATVLNTLVKSLYIYLIGGKEIFKLTLLPIVLISLSGILSFFIFISI